MKRALAVFVCLSFVCKFAQASDDFGPEGEAWWEHVKVLADDNMEGRNTGSEGYRRAAAYVAGEFERLRLEPAGTKRYYQTMKFRVRQIVEPRSKLELVGDGKVEELDLGEDANFGLPADFATKIEAGAVFVGYGLVIPEFDIDDLAGLDLKGKIAVILSGGPKRVPGPMRAHYSHQKQRWQALRNAGAIGMALISNPTSTDVPWARATLARLQPTMSLADPKLDDAAGMKISLRINPARADKFLAGSGHKIDELLRLSDTDQALPAFPLAVAVRARLVARKSTVISANVAGILPGSDPELKKQYVVLSAHLDHLGIGQPINGHRIYNGAMDNASGVASVLEVAKWLKASPVSPKRSVLFLIVTGEEKGLQGSKYFANHSTVPRSAIVADLNTDMFLPIHSLKIVRVFGLDESTLGDDIRAVCGASGLKVQADPEPDRNVFIRSDQYSFIRQGVPSLFFGFGYEPGSPEEKLHRDWRKNRYHAPSDDLAQPVNKVAAAQFSYLLMALTERVTNAPVPPTWKADSFFRRFAN